MTKQKAVALNSDLIKIMDGMKPKLSRISEKPVNNRSDILRVFIDYFSKLDDAGKMVDQAKWIFDPESEPTNDQIYDLLKNNDEPKLAKYLFLTFGSKSEYRRNKAFIFLQMADPESPFYLKYVADALQGLIEVKNAKDELHSLKNEISRLKPTMEALREEYDELSKSFEEKTQRNAELEKKLTSYAEEMLVIIEHKPFDVVKAHERFLTDLLEKVTPQSDQLIYSSALRKWIKEERDRLIELSNQIEVVKNRVSETDLIKELQAKQMEQIRILNELKNTEWKDYRKNVEKLEDIVTAFSQVEANHQLLMCLNTDNYDKLQTIVMNLTKIGASLQSSKQRESGTQ